jgi:hypothetical protein
MGKLSKGFYAGGWGAGIGLGLLLLLVGIATIAGSRGRDADAVVRGVFFIVQAYIPILFAAVVMLVLVYKMWAAIQDGQVRTTPGKALGFLFIPFFNFYWVFQVFPGFADDYNAYATRHSLNVPRLERGIFLAYCILTLCALVPILGMLCVVVNFVIALIMISRICDAVNALAAAPRPPAAAPIG